MDCRAATIEIFSLADDCSICQHTFTKPGMWPRVSCYCLNNYSSAVETRFWSYICSNFIKWHRKSNTFFTFFQQSHHNDVRLWILHSFFFDVMEAIWCKEWPAQSIFITDLWGQQHVWHRSTKDVAGVPSNGMDASLHN